MNNNYKKTIEKKASLQVYPHIQRKSYINIIDLHIKRMSLFFFQDNRGSITVEAAIAVPLFLFFLANILSIILIFGEYTQNLSQLHQRAKEMSIVSHLSEKSTNTHNDLIILTKVQTIEPIIPFISYPSSKTIVNCRIRKWTGYQNENLVTDKVEEEWVYITQTGNVYHRSRSCSHINISIHCCSLDCVSSLRNRSGEKYRLCERCGASGGLGLVYITEQGNRYHTNVRCSGLKRTIETIPISKVAQRRPCSKCG